MIPEIEQYLARLDNSRNLVADLIRDLPAEALNWRPPLPEGADPMNSIGVLAVHLAGAEHFWIGENIGGAPPTRDRDAEFAFVAESAEEPLRRLEAVAEETRAVLAPLTAQEMDGTLNVRGRQLPTRFAIIHIIDHYALHLGHMQITYQLWSGGKAFQAPRWHQRPQN